MKYIPDHDLHIHTCLSICSQDKEQTPENILKIAKQRGLKTICITDHYWDSAVPVNSRYNWWYERQNYDHVAKSLPLPEDDSVRFLFGCEVDLDADNRIGLPRERYDDFDFIIVSTTHFQHMIGEKWENCDNQTLAKYWVERMDALLDLDLPFEKVGVAHPACSLIQAESYEDYLKVLDLIPEEEMVRIFNKAARVGMGIELNFGNRVGKCDDEVERILRMFRIAKRCGCKFYFGSDSHDRASFAGKYKAFPKIVDLLDLTEDDKFTVPTKSL